MSNQCEPWWEQGITELKYWKMRYIESQQEVNKLKTQLAESVRVIIEMAKDLPAKSILAGELEGTPATVPLPPSDGTGWASSE